MEIPFPGACIRPMLKEENRGKRGENRFPLQSQSLLPPEAEAVMTAHVQKAATTQPCKMQVRSTDSTHIKVLVVGWR